MKGKFRKVWRAFTAIALAASLALVALPAPAAAQGGLQVNIITPADGTEVDPGQEFWVNAAVAKPIGVTSCADINATITWVPADGVELVEGDPTQHGPDLSNCHSVDDFWWKFKCAKAGVDVEFTVTGTSLTCGTGTDKVTVKQKADPCRPKLIVDIIECPDQVILEPSSIFAVKALVTNNTSETICGVKGIIDIKGFDNPEGCPEGGAELRNCVPVWDIGCIPPYCQKEVGWTLHCTAPGWVKITVDADFDGEVPPCDVDPDECLVHQRMPAKMGVEITSAPEKVCTDCGEKFTVTARISELCGDTGIDNVTADITWVPAAGATIVPPPAAHVTLPAIPPGGHQDVTWTLDCNAAGDIVFTVTGNGTDHISGAPVTASDTTTVKQRDLIVNIVSPPDKSKFNVCQNYDLVYTIKNCTEDEMSDVTVSVILPILPGQTESDIEVVAGSKVDVVCGGTTEHLDWAQDPSYTGPGIKFDAHPVCICPCCEGTVTWHLHCKDTQQEDCTPIAEEIIAQAWDNSTLLDSDTVTVYQMEKAHLEASIEVMEGTMSDGNFEGDDLLGGVSPCNKFTVVVPVANLGQARAKNVKVTLCVTGPATTQEPLTQEIPLIGCQDSEKLFWVFHCDAEGDVKFEVCALTGTDENTNQPIPADNIRKPCPYNLAQIPLDVIIIQPLTCTDIIVGDTFTVKARITNGSTLGKTLEDVEAELKWVPADGIVLAPGQGNPVDIGNLPAGASAEATWQVKCNKEGDVTFFVEAKANRPYMEAYSEKQTIHQRLPGDLVCRVLSPTEGTCGDAPYIATSQDFALTVEVKNTGGFPITVTSSDVTFLPPGSASVVSGPTPPLPWQLDPLESIVVNWTLHCDKAAMTEIKVTIKGEDTLCLKHQTYCTVTVEQYPAAHLEVNITEYPMTPILVSTTFPVTAVITNTGEADAWEAVATLSVTPEGSVRISPSDPDGGFTKNLGTLVGHGQDGSATVTWILHCKAPCESTITISAGGFDEFGFHTKQRYSYTCHDWVLDLEPEAGRPIEGRFVEPDSVTVKQLESGGLDLGVTKTSDKQVYTLGETVEYTIEVTNYGPTNASGVVVQETLPVELSNWTVQTITQGTYNVGTGVWTVGSIVNGAKATLKLSAQIDIKNMITNQVTVSADQPDGYPVNNSVSVTIDPGNYDVSLLEGWNLISLPYYIEPANRNPANLLAGISGNLNAVHAYDACTAQWKYYAPSGPPGDLTQMRDGPGYWVEMNAPATLAVVGNELPPPPQLPPSYNVCVGWNLIGFKSISPKTAANYLAAIAGQYTVIYGYHAGEYFLVQPNDLLQPSYGYWIAVTQPGTIYP